MKTFLYKYVANSRADSGIFNAYNWNSGTMNFLRENPNPNPTEPRPLRAVGERFSFASTNDMLWLQQDGCKAQNTPFEFARDKWFGNPTTYKSSKKKKAIVSKIARKGGMVSGVVFHFKPKGLKYCEDQSTSLEYMDCTRRISKNGSPICLLAGWYSLGGYECVGKSLVFNDDDKSSAKSLQEFFGASYNRGNGFFMKVRGMDKMKGGCDMQSSSIAGVLHGWVGVVQFSKKEGGKLLEKIISPQKSESMAQKSIKNFLNALKKKKWKANRQDYGKKMVAGKTQVMTMGEKKILKRRQDKREKKSNGETSEEANGGASSRKSPFVAASKHPESSNTASRLAFFFFGAVIFLGMYVAYIKSISNEESYYSLLNTNGDGSEL